MGKAASELPADTLDPTEMAEKAAAVDVDELLAQMAGEEIDRLLSEADDPRERRAKAAATSAPESAPVVETFGPPAAEASADDDAASVDEAVSRQLDELFEAATAGDAAPAPAEARAPEPVVEVMPPAPTPAEPEPAPAAAAPAADDPLAKQLDDLFAQLEGGGGGTPAAAPVPPAIAEAPAPAPVAEIAPPPPPVVEEPVATNSEERSALGAPMPEVEILTEGQEPEDDALPWYLKPLAWINAPLDSLPDPVRELIGKLGLLTLFNACAVLLYVFVFRKHHH